jgi:hypothetical protein
MPVVVVLDDALLPAAPDLGRVIAVVVVRPAPVDVLPAVVVVTESGDVAVVVVEDEEGDWAGGTSVDALQICVYEGLGPGGGSVGLSGALTWNLKPSTSSGGLDTDCSEGPLLA